MPTTNTEFIDQIMFRLGRRAEPYLRTQVINELNIAKTELEQGAFLPWFLETETTLSLVQGGSSVPLPIGFLREIEGLRVHAVKVSDGTQFRMFKRRGETMDWLDTNYTYSGPPARYAVIGGNLRIWPDADAVYEIHFPYISSTASIDDTGALNSWFQYAPNLLIGMAGAQTAAVVNPDKISSFNGMAARAKAELIAAHEAREHTNLDYSASDSLVEEED